MGPSSLRVGVVRDPETHPDWSRFKAFLEPARLRGGLDTPLLDENELLWAVYRGFEPIAAATTRLTVDDVSEVALVGGSDHREWISELDDAIAACSRSSGAKVMRAFGRRGWIKVLRRNGWRVIGERDGVTGFERAL